MNADWVKQALATAGGGTGNLTLGSAVDTSHMTLVDAGIAVGERFNYQAIDGADREAGVGYLSASTTLVRETVVRTISSGVPDITNPTPLNLSDAAVITISASTDAVLPAYPRPLGATAAERRIIGQPGMASVTFSTITLAANYLYVSPFYWPGGVLNNLYVQITTAGAAGTKIRCGLADVSAGLSALRVLCDSGELACDATGMVGGAVNLGYLRPGHYAIMVTSSGAPAVAAMSTGMETPFGWLSTNAQYKVVRRHQVRTYAALSGVIDISGATVTNSSSSTTGLAAWGSD